MRITNKIMQNNAVVNINTNKLLQDKLNTQMTTQSKIVRPSDDPVVAIRALRLRTNLSEITQYYEKNIPDADSWLKVTEDALNSMTGIVTDMYSNCESGAKGFLKAEDREKVLENLRQLRKGVYDTGDADYAGRNLFTGYRTNVRLSFQNDTTIPYKITEQLTKENMDSFTYVNKGDLKDIAGNTTEHDVDFSTVNRIRLSYEDLNAGVKPTIKVPIQGSFTDGNQDFEELKINGNPLEIETMSKTGEEDPNTNPYLKINDPAYANKAIFVPETGELLLGSNVKAALDVLPKNEEIQISYQKDEWKEGDLRPEHYFACDAVVNGKTIKYNEDYLLSSKKEMDITKQYISYDVGFNQSLRVNTLASECFTHNIGRDVDELITVTQQTADMDKLVQKLQSMVDSGNYDDTTNPSLKDLETRLAAANKAYTLLNDKCQKMFEHGMTQMQGYLDQTNLAMTNVGSRSVRLEMVENRLRSQQTNFKELTVDNEGADVTELAIQLKSAALSYDAALMATGKIVQNSLMNFI